MNKYYIRTYDNGVHSVMAHDIKTAIEMYLILSGRQAVTIRSAGLAMEEGMG